MFCLIDPQTGTIVAAGQGLGQWTDLAQESAVRHIDQLAPGLGAQIAEFLRAESMPTDLEVPSTGPSGAPTSARVTRLRGEGADLVLVEFASGPREPMVQWEADAVTGLPDRRALAPHRARWISGPAPAPHALLFLDLDGFKRVNDEHGHAAGDRVLAELADRWRRCVREGDLVVRYGGDEFVVLLGHIGSRTDVEPIVGRLEAAAQQAFQIAGQEIELSATTGVALGTDSSIPLEELIAAADRDMYAAKARRKT